MNKLEMDEKRRKSFYEYALKIGFIIKGFPDWSENKRISKLRQYMRQGFRIVDYGEEFKVINIFYKDFNDRKLRNVENLYLWLIEDSPECLEDKK